MHIRCLTPCEPGVYDDRKADRITVPPAGWDAPDAACEKGGERCL